MYFVFIYENRIMKPAEIVSTYVSITMYPLVQLLHGNKKKEIPV
jgi:hypothetical protein